jgi:hypothetical protein
MKKSNLLKKLIILFVWLLVTSQGFAQNWKVYDGAAKVNVANSSGTLFGTPPTYTFGDGAGTGPTMKIDTLSNGNKGLIFYAANANRGSYRFDSTGGFFNALYTNMPQTETVIFRVRSRDSLGTTKYDHGFETELYTYRKDSISTKAFKFIMYMACNDTIYFENPTTPKGRFIAFTKAEQLKWHTYRLTIDTGGICKLYIDENTTPAYSYKATTSTSNIMYGKVGVMYTTAPGITSLKSEIDWIAWDFKHSFAPGTGTLPSGVFVDGVHNPSAKAITAFNFVSPAATGTIDEGLKTIAITVPKYTAVTALTPTIVSSTGSYVTPTGAIDFTSPVTFTVAAEDFSTQTYQATVTVASLNDKKAITSFSIPGQIGPSVINTTAHTVAVTMPFGTDVTGLIPTIAVSQDAVVAPLSGVAQNFTGSVNYTVTAEDASTQVWAVTVLIAPNTATDITTFDFDGLAPAVVGVPNATEKIVRLTVPFGTDLTALVPTIALSPNATIIPLSGVAQNFTDTVSYTVTAGDATTTQVWKVKVNVTPAATDATLSSLKVNGTTIADFSPATILYRYVVPASISIVPTVTATKNNVFATVLITPAAAIPDTTKVLVTAQDGSTKTYNVAFIHPSTDVWTVYDGSKKLDDPSNTYPFVLSHGSSAPTVPTDTVVDDEDIAGNKVIRFESLGAAQNLFNINPFAITSDSSKITIIVRLRDYKDSVYDAGAAKNVFADHNSDIDVYYAGFREKWFGQNTTLYTKPNIKAEKRNQASAVYGVDSIHVSDVAHWHIYRVVIDTIKGTRLFVDEKLDSVNGGYYNWVNGTTRSFKLALGDGSQTVPYSALWDYVIWTKGAYEPGQGPAIPSELSTSFWSDSTLTGLKINDTVFSAFNPKTFTYTIVLPDTLTKPTITGTTNNVNANTVVTNITTFPGIAKIVVTAEDGKSKATYSINFTYAGAKSIVSSLSDLKVSGTTVTGFLSSDLSYDVALPIGTTTVPVVTAVTTDAKAAAVVTPAASLPGKTTILVTAEDNSYTTTYEINFTVIKSPDATLTGIKYGTTSISNFNKNTSHYSIHLPEGTTDVPVVTVTKSYPAASVVITPAASLPGETTIVVTAEDGTTTKTYYVSFTVMVGIGTLNEGELSVYPNPAENFLNIKLGNRSGIANLFNLLGEQVLSKSINGSGTLDISNLKKGLYLLKININGIYYIQKVVVLR